MSPELELLAMRIPVPPLTGMARAYLPKSPKKKTEVYFLCASIRNSYIPSHLWTIAAKYIRYLNGGYAYCVLLHGESVYLDFGRPFEKFPIMAVCRSRTQAL